MSEKYYIELMHKEIDGMISPKERAKLFRHLAANAEAKKLYDELCQTTAFLGRAQRAEPSPNIKKYILNAIDPTRYRPAPKPLRRSAILAPVFGKPVVKLATVFSLGLVFGMLIFSATTQQLFLRRGINGAEVSGTIGAEKPGFTTIQTWLVDSPAITGSFVLQKSAGLIKILAAVSTQEAMEMRLHYDATRLVFSHISSTGPAPFSFAPGGEEIRLTGSGELQVSLFFEPIKTDGDSVEVQLFAVGELIWSQKMVW